MLHSIAIQIILILIIYENKYEKETAKTTIRCSISITKMIFYTDI